jgi:hypothetical protein
MQGKIFEYIISYQTSGSGGMVIVLQVEKELSYFPVIKSKQLHTSINTGGGFSNRITINKEYLNKVEEFLKTQNIDNFDLLIESSDRLAMITSEIMAKQLPIQPITLSLKPLNNYTHVKFISNPKRYEIKGDDIGSNYFTSCKITNKQVKVEKDYSTGYQNKELYYITFTNINSNSSYDNGYAYLNPDLTLKYGTFSINSLDSSPINNDPKDVYCKFQLFGNERLLKIEEILKDDE